MSVLLLLVAGFVSNFGEGGACIDALQELRTGQRLQIVATDVLEDNVLAFTLSDSARINQKTALLVCQRDLEADDDVDEDLDGTDDTAVDPLQPADEPGDDGGQDATDLQ
jgi:hypothetical protein